MAQELNIGTDWLEYVKIQAQAEKDLKIEPWVIVRICYKDEGQEVELYRYDIPRHMLRRWEWVMNWRAAKLQCQYPRKYVYRTLSHYDKRSAEVLDWGSCLSQLISFKGKVTMQKNRLKEYLEQNKGNLFFDEETDEQVIKCKTKIQRAEKLVLDIEARLKEKVIKHKQNNE